MAKGQYVLSLDPAKSRDWSALSAIKVYPVREKRRWEYDMVALARKQKLPYDHETEPSIASWVVKTYQNRVFWGNEPPIFLIDATGVGDAVADIIEAKGIPVERIVITPGNAATQEGSKYHVGKAKLIGKFLGVIDAGKFHLNPALPIMPVFERELTSFKAKVTAHGNTQFEAEEGEHDDLILSPAQAVWYCQEMLTGGL
jgi:hypothetical protein